MISVDCRECKRIIPKKIKSCCHEKASGYALSETVTDSAHRGHETSVTEKISCGKAIFPFVP